MLTILMATDFSKASENAYRYCLMLAGVKPCRILVTHIYKHHSAVDLSDDQVQAFISHERMQLADKTRKFSQLYPDAVMPEIISHCTVEVLVEEGPVSDTVLQLAKEQNADVIVIGSKRHPGLLKRMFGQISSTLIYDRNQPVMVVPEDSVEVSTERIGLLGLHHTDEERLMTWKQGTSMAIHDYRVCRLHESPSAHEDADVLQISARSWSEKVEELNNSDFHWFAVLISGMQGETESDRRNFIHDLYRRSRKPFLCLP